MSQKPTGPGGANATSRIAPKDGAPAPPVPSWCCPLCGSDRLTVRYMELRASSVGTDPDTREPCTDYARDDFIDIDPDLYVFICEGCLSNDEESRASF